MSEIRAIPGGVVLISPDDAAYLARWGYALAQVAAQRLGVRIPNQLKVIHHNLADAATCAGTCAQVPETPEMTQSDPNLIDPKTAAQRLGTSEANVRDLCTRGSLDAMKTKGRWWIVPASVDDHKTNRSRSRKEA
jgi:hypothetical protein